MDSKGNSVGSPSSVVPQPPSDAERYWLAECDACDGEGGAYWPQPRWDDPFFEVRTDCEHCSGTGRVLKESVV